jgi:hypothetical protein
MQAVTPGGRLTLTTGVPVTTSDVTGATSVYYTPYVHDTIALWDGARWIPVTFTETTEALGTLTSGLPYDVFGFLSSGVLDLEKLAWTNGTTRATAVTLQDGRYCKSGDKTRLYLGTFYTTSTTTTEDSAGGTTTQVGGKRFLWNMYNQRNRFAGVKDTSAAWVYKTGTWRQANGATGNKVEFILGLAGPLNAQNLVSVACSNNATRGGVGIGLDSTTAPTGFSQAAYNGATATYTIAASNGRFSVVAAAGYHYVAQLEIGATGTDCQFDGNDATSGQTGLTAWFDA